NTMPEYEFWKEHASSFESIAGSRSTANTTLVDGERHDPIVVLAVTADFFRTLGVAPEAGREFSTSEASRGGPAALILSDALWRRAFGANPGAVGRIIRLGAAPY